MAPTTWKDDGTFLPVAGLDYWHGPSYPMEAQMSSKQYREFARECLRWAEESASEEDRRHFIDMAKAWVQAAAELRDLSDHSETQLSRRARRKTSNGRNGRVRT
jgi:hypothetical protein